MSETKFTKGPWKVFHTSDGRTILGVGDRNAVGITDCGDVASNDLGVWRSGSEKAANAHLIAAAPELYEALDGWVRYLDVQSAGSAEEEERLLGAMRAALAKARGETA